MTAVGGWKLFARCIASSFLFLVGVSLFLGHAQAASAGTASGGGFAMVAGAALAISRRHLYRRARRLHLLRHTAPDRAGERARPRLPAAAGVADAGRRGGRDRRAHYLRSTFFDHPWWWWIGLSDNRPRSNDYVPVFPWFGAVLVGIAAAKIAERTGLFARLASLAPGAGHGRSIFGGRHSLAVYLIHQPVLIGCVWLFSQVFPPTVETPRGALPAILRGSLRASSATPNSARAIVSACSTRWSARTRSKASMPATGARNCRAGSRTSPAAARSRLTTRCSKGEANDRRQEEARHHAAAPAPARRKPG